VNLSTQKPMPCTSCQLCDDACPEGLATSTLIALIALCRTPSTTGTTHAERLDDLNENGLMHCTDCGKCTAACPSHLPLADLLEHGKALANAETRERAASAHWKTRFEKRQRRVEAKQRNKRALKPATQKPQGALVPQAASSTPVSPALPATRDKAQADIAAAVARVKAKRAAKSAQLAREDTQSK
jgi:electron transport complex protein RnfC